MELTVSDRLLLLNMLPREGDLATIRKTYAISKELEFTPNEKQLLEFKEENGAIKWAAAKDMPVPVSLMPDHLAFIQVQIDRLSEAKALTVQHVPLLEKLFPEAKLRAV